MVVSHDRSGCFDLTEPLRGVCHGCWKYTIINASQQVMRGNTSTLIHAVAMLPLNALEPHKWVVLLESKGPKGESDTCRQPVVSRAVTANNR